MKHKLKLKPFQIDTINKMTGRDLIAFDPGLGKSATAITYAKKHPETWPIVVVCPASLKWNWKKEIKLWAGWLAKILEGTYAPKELITKRKIVIINYDILAKWLKTLKKWKPKLLILDESHLLKNRGALRSRATKNLARIVPYIIELTGTPIVNRSAELWNLLNILDKDAFPSFESYAWRFCRPYRTRWGWNFSRSCNLKELHKLLKKYMIRYRTKDVIDQLPDKERIAVPLAMKSNNKYDKSLADLVKWLKTVKPRKIDAIVKGKIFQVKHIAAQEKMPAVCEWIDNFLEDSSEKIILFAHHKDIIDTLEKRYKSIAVKIDGSVSKHKRLKIVETFNRSKSLRVFIGNIDAAGVGLNITGAKTMAFVELAYTPGQLSQCESRSYARLSDMHGLKVYYLVAKGTIEESICRILNKKAKIINAIVDGKSNKVNDDSTFSELLTILKKKGK